VSILLLRFAEPDCCDNAPPARATISFGVAPKGERFLFQIDPGAEYQTLSVMLDWESRLD
jgi:hypothetical protein